MKQAAPIKESFNILKEAYPYAKIALNFEDDWQLLVAVVLSAQCTDERVNKVTPALFKRFPGVRDFAEAEVCEIEKLIYSTGFYRNKAKNIKAAAEKVVSAFGSEVPGDMDSLLSLPGVARKTANVVLHTAFSKSVGIVVDTHVIRVSGKLGWIPQKYAKNKNAVKIEKLLMEKIPKDDWGISTHLLISHGRKICIARRPKCSDCPLNHLCPSTEL